MFLQPSYDFWSPTMKGSRDMMAVLSYDTKGVIQEKKL